MLFLSGLLHVERVRRGTRKNTRALSTYRQAMLALRRLFDDTRMTQLARDNGIGVSTAYAYRDEAVAVLAAGKPSLRGALLAAKAAGHSHVIVDGTLIYTDRDHAPGPTAGVDLWWSGKHHHHGGNIQVVSAPDGWPLWTSDVRPGREHDTTSRPRRPRVRSPRSAPGSMTVTSAWPIWATRARPTCSACGSRRPRDASWGCRSAGLQRRPRRQRRAGRASQQPDQDHLQGTTPLARVRASATSSPQRWYCSTTKATAQHDPKITPGDQHVARKGCRREGAGGHRQLEGSPALAASSAWGEVCGPRVCPDWPYRPNRHVRGEDPMVVRSALGANRHVVGPVHRPRQGARS